MNLIIKILFSYTLHKVKDGQDSKWNRYFFVNVYKFTNQQATQSTQSWYDYPEKSCTAVICDMITCDLEWNI